MYLSSSAAPLENIKVGCAFLKTSFFYCLIWDRVVGGIMYNNRVLLVPL